MRGQQVSRCENNGWYGEEALFHAHIGGVGAATDVEDDEIVLLFDATDKPVVTYSSQCRVAGFTRSLDYE